MEGQSTFIELISMIPYFSIILEEFPYNGYEIL